MESFKKIVMLIDADNTQRAKLERVIQEISSSGRIVVKRAYGNWAKDTLKNWDVDLKRLAIKAIQQFDYVSHKNATDMAMVIDAMDLLHNNLYDAFVIVSSDSDYTPLAIKLRESGVYVYGVGRKDTPDAFKMACDEFITLENLDMDEKKVNAEELENKDGDVASESKVEKMEESMPEFSADCDEELKVKEEIKKAEAEKQTEIVAEAEEVEVSTEETEENDELQEIHNLLKIASDKYQDGAGFVNVSSAGTFIKRTKPDFDVRTFGYVKLPELLEDFPEKYEVKRYKGKGTVTIVAYKCKD